MPKSLQEKLDETARLLEPVLWEVLKEIEEEHDPNYGWVTEWEDDE